MENTGIILKTLFPKKRKMIVLDSKLGKIEAVPSHENFTIGSLLSYCPQMQGSLYFLREINILDIPLALAKSDILFLHHVIEICYFCIPFDKSSVEIFNMIHQLYQPEIQSYNHAFKIAFLFKLLISLGMHPEESRFHDSAYYILARESIDTILDKSIDLDTDCTLHEWVRSCILIHPLIHIFKTVHFLDK